MLKRADAAAADALEAAVRRAKKIVRRRAAFSAGMSLVPVPGMDVAADAAALLDMMQSINEAFHLSPQQIDRLDMRGRLETIRAVDATGALFAGRTITQGLVLVAVKQLGIRWASSKTAKWIPIAGQTAAAALSYTVFCRLGDQHIAECVAVRERVAALLESPSTSRNEFHART